MFNLKKNRLFNVDDFQRGYNQYLIEKNRAGKENEKKTPETVGQFDCTYKYQYARIPSQFYDKNSRYHKLMTSSKLIYAVLGSMVEWNGSQGILDENQNPYLEISRRGLHYLFGISEDRIRMSMIELAEAGLILRAEDRQGRVNRFYVYDLAEDDKDSVRTCNPSEFKYAYYRLPAAFFMDTTPFNSLSKYAKFLYPMLVACVEWDAKKHFKKGEVPYTIITRKRMEERLNLSDKTVLKAIHELEDMHLIYDNRTGFRQPDHIYVNGIKKAQQLLDNESNGKSPIPPICTDGLGFFDSSADCKKQSSSKIRKKAEEELAKREEDAAASDTAVDTEKNSSPSEKTETQKKPKKQKKERKMAMPVAPDEFTDETVSAYAASLLEAIQTAGYRTYFVGAQTIKAETMKEKVKDFGREVIEYATNVVLQAQDNIRNLQAYLIAVFYNYKPGSQAKQSAGTEQTARQTVSGSSAVKTPYARTKRTSFCSYDQRNYTDEQYAEILSQINDGYTAEPASYEYNAISYTENERESVRDYFKRIRFGMENNPSPAY